MSGSRHPTTHLHQLAAQRVHSASAAGLQPLHADSGACCCYWQRVPPWARLHALWQTYKAWFACLHVCEAGRPWWSTQERQTTGQNTKLRCQEALKANVTCGSGQFSSRCSTDHKLCCATACNVMTYGFWVRANQRGCKASLPCLCTCTSVSCWATPCVAGSKTFSPNFTKHCSCSDHQHLDQHGSGSCIHGRTQQLKASCCHTRTPSASEQQTPAHHPAAAAPKRVRTRPATWQPLLDERIQASHCGRHSRCLCQVVHCPPGPSDYLVPGAVVAAHLIRQQLILQAPSAGHTSSAMSPAGTRLVKGFGRQHCACQVESIIMQAWMPLRPLHASTSRVGTSRLTGSKQRRNKTGSKHHKAICGIQLWC